MYVRAGVPSMVKAKNQEKRALTLQVPGEVLGLPARGLSRLLTESEVSAVQSSEEYSRGLVTLSYFDDELPAPKPTPQKPDDAPATPKGRRSAKTASETQE